MRLLGDDFQLTEQELNDWFAGGSATRNAVVSLLDRAASAAEDRFASATTPREQDSWHGAFRCAKELRDAFRGAPARFDDLARRRKQEGNSQGAAGFV